MVTTIIIIAICLVAVVSVVVSAYKFGTVIGEGQARSDLKRKINKMTVRELLVHKRNNLKTL
jgi:uncharacterized membrane protein